MANNPSSNGDTREQLPSFETPNKDDVLLLVKIYSSMHTKLIAGAASSSNEDFDDLPPSKVLKRVEALKEKIANSDEEVNLISPSEPNNNEHIKQVVLRVLDIIIELFQAEKYRDLLDIYYTGYELFGKKSVSDSAVEYICSTLDCAQSTLNIFDSDFCNPPGTVAGLFSFKMYGTEHLCSNTCTNGKTIPTFTNSASDMKNHEALFVLLVQDYSTFTHLIQANFCNDYPCILIAGAYFPTTAIIRFSKKVSKELKLPLFCLLDCDQLNLYIVSGCGDGPNRLPSYTKWLGIWPTDISDLSIAEINIPELNIPNVKKSQADFNMLHMIKKKAEDDALCMLSKVFVPFRLKQIIQTEIEKFPDLSLNEELTQLSCM